MNLKNKIKFIYFDLDNTLWDFKRNSDISLEKVYREKISPLGDPSIDFPSFKEVYEKYNHALWRAYERGEVKSEQLQVTRFQKTIEELGITSVGKGEELNHFYTQNLVKLPHLMPKAKEILDYLSPNYNLGILSNGFKNLQYMKMNHSDIIHYFNPIITSDQIGFNKPHPEIFHYAIEKTGLSPKEIAYVGDDYLVDTVAANQRGITGILLDPNDRIADQNIIKVRELIALKEYF